VIEIILLSLRIAILATVLNIPLAYAAVMVKRRYEKISPYLDAFFSLPLVLPPVVTGYILLIFLGRNSTLGTFYEMVFQAPIAFTSTASVLAAMVMSFPLLYRSVGLSIDEIPMSYFEIAASLGAGKRERFLRIIIPQSMKGLITGSVLAFARALGEFGATITFAGNIPGKTRTISLGIYSFLQVPNGEQSAFYLVLASVILSVTAVFISNSVQKKSRSFEETNHAFTF
jgi:molybdate transport system permease protein